MGTLPHFPHFPYTSPHFPHSSTLPTLIENHPYPFRNTMFHFRNRNWTPARCILNHCSSRMWVAIGCLSVILLLGLVSMNCDPIRRRLTLTEPEKAHLRKVSEMDLSLPKAAWSLRRIETILAQKEHTQFHLQYRDVLRVQVNNALIAAKCNWTTRDINGKTHYIDQMENDRGVMAPGIGEY